jgi:hypothetical protein
MPCRVRGRGHRISGGAGSGLEGLAFRERMVSVGLLKASRRDEHLRGVNNRAGSALFGV